jgi:ribosomal protein S18 acetylase RimI-like enzyme
MSRFRALELQRGSLRDYIEMLATGSAGARLIEFDGVVANATPAVPARSISNPVSYEDAGALAAAYEELAAAFDDAGIEAWTVWVPEFDAEAIELLERRGHVFDGSPGAMTLDLARFEPPPLGDLEWDHDCDGPLLGLINDRAYGHEPGDGYSGGFTGLRVEPPRRLYRALIEGRPACVMGTIDHAHPWGEVDCGIYFVATDPAYGRRGLATRLLAAALIEARKRGCATSTLQASGAGRPVYEALGYESDFDLHLYERRRGREA